jgi:hypothetical protein
MDEATLTVEVVSDTRVFHSEVCQVSLRAETLRESTSGFATAMGGTEAQRSYLYTLSYMIFVFALYKFDISSLFDRILFQKHNNDT